MSVTASGQDVINWLKQWKQAVELGSMASELPPGFWAVFDNSVEYFEDGGQYNQPFVLYKQYGQ